MSQIGILVASSNNNQKLALQLEKVAHANNCKTVLINLVDLHLPLYSTKEEEKNGVPSTVITLVEQVMPLKAFIIVAPEYNGLIPPVLNNAMAWMSRGTKQWRDVFNEKVVALATHSGGGGTKGIQAMRIMMAHLGANLLAREIITNYEKTLSEDAAQSIVTQLARLTRA